MRGLIGTKLGMTRVFDSNGSVVPITIIEAGPCAVTQIKTVERDGYSAIQAGFGDKKEKRTNKPLRGHFSFANVAPKKVLVEFESVPGYDYKLGQIFDVNLFNEGDLVNVIGRSKGKGFSGVIKRHNFARQKKTHGTGHTMRAPGSIGQASDPSRVFPGMRMAGRYGNSRVTVENLMIFKIDYGRNEIHVKGAVPGSKNGTVIITK